MCEVNNVLLQELLWHLLVRSEVLLLGDLALTAVRCLLRAFLVIANELERLTSSGRVHPANVRAHTVFHLHVEQLKFLDLKNFAKVVALHCANQLPEFAAG